MPCAGVEVDSLVIGASVDDRGPIWGESVTGPGGNRMTLVWPQGFSARLVEGTVQVLDPAGRVVANQGDTIESVEVCRLADGKWAIVAFEGFPPP
jgi:hypothetical protein